MAEYNYIRVSTCSQNIARQVDGKYELFIDKVSGSVPFSKREKGAELLRILQPFDVLHISSIDRLGRDMIDILFVIKLLTDRKVNIRVANLSLDSLIKETGKENPVFKLIIAVLSVIAEQERKTILERQKQGIVIAKSQGKYRGRKRGTTYSRSVYLERNKEAVKVIKKHESLSLRALAKLTDLSVGKVSKIKSML